MPISVGYHLTFSFSFCLKTELNSVRNDRFDYVVQWVKYIYSNMDVTDNVFRVRSLILWSMMTIPVVAQVIILSECERAWIV